MRRGRERKREERKEKRKRESGFWVGKGEQRRSSLLSLREFLSLEARKEGRKEGRMVIWTIEISLPRMGWMTLRTISVPRREECIIPGMFEAIAKW